MREDIEYQIWIKDHSETMEDDSDNFKTTYTELSYVAEEYADYYHGNRDGWEASWPIIFSIARDGKHLGDVSVDRETRPHFTGRLIKEPK